MKKGLSILIFLIIVVGIFLVLKKNNFPENNVESYLEINQQKISLEIRRTSAEREKGLSGRENLCEECGMLFIFEKAGSYQFWMKEMKFDIDMLWLSGTKVVKIRKNVPFAKGKGEIVDPQIQADKVLEINAGKSEEWGIEEGMEVIFNLTK